MCRICYYLPVRLLHTADTSLAQNSNAADSTEGLFSQKQGLNEIAGDPPPAPPLPHYPPGQPPNSAPACPLFCSCSWPLTTSYTSTAGRVCPNHCAAENILLRIRP